MWCSKPIHAGGHFEGKRKGQSPGQRRILTLLSSPTEEKVEIPISSKPSFGMTSQDGPYESERPMFKGAFDERGN
jgi:hypothetical protein